MSYKAWMYKGKEAKIFDRDGLKEAMMQGWVDNPADANRSPEELLADLEVLEKAKRAALAEAERLVLEEAEEKAEKEEAEFQAELQKEKESAASGTITTETP